MLPGTPKERAERYRQELVEGGLSEHEAAEIAADSLAVDEALDALTCPRCKGPLRRTVDQRQAGVTRIQGSWINYRCSVPGCRWAIDRVEPDDE